MQIIGSAKTDRVAAALAASDAALWMQTYLQTSMGQAFDFAKHLYELELLSLDHPRVDLRKAAQLGFTECLIGKACHVLIHRGFRQGVIYMFPTDFKVGEFSQLRWRPFLDNNPYHVARHVAKTDNVHNKRIGQGNLMFRGAQLTHSVDAKAKESAELRGDPADWIVRDEVDLFPVAAIGKSRARLGHSDYKWEWQLSNPTLPHYGIDAAFEAGDQRYWAIRCAACNHWNFLDIEFPYCLRRQADGRVIRICVRCERELPLSSPSQWVAKFPQRSAAHISYHASKLMSWFAEPQELLEHWEHPPEGNLADVKRMDFGLPHLDAQFGLTANEVLLLCTAEPAAAASAVPTAVGVDVGKKLHVVIGYRIGSDAYRLIALLLLDSFEELLGVARTFSAELTSIDNEPEIRAARDYQAKGPGQIWLSDYVESIAPAHYDEHTRVVKCNRTEYLDATHFYLRTPGHLWLPRQTPVVELFAGQCAAMAKVIEKNPKTGDQKGIWVQVGPQDHFRHALVNFLLAARRQTPIQYRSTDTTGARGASASGWNLFQ
jgi:hypothetical protein